MEEILPDFIRSHNPLKIYGVLLEGHTWNDPCPYCQDLFWVRTPFLQENLKKKFLLPLKNNFFILPVLSSQKWYPQSKRPKPSNLPAISELSLDLGDKRTLKENHRDFLQYTSDYKEWFESQISQKSFELQEDLINKKIFPCFWLPKAEEISISLQQKIYSTFTKARRRSSNSPLAITHPDLQITQNFSTSFFKNLVTNLTFFVNLTELNLASNHLGNQGASELATALPQLPFLQSLNLQNNMFGKEKQGSLIILKDSVAFNSLINAFASLKNLTFLNLSQNYLGIEALTAFSQIMPNLQSLRFLSCEESDLEIASKGSKVFSVGLYSLVSLEELCLKKNKLTYKNAEEILVYTAQLSKLRTLDLSGNRICWHLTDTTTIENAIRDLVRDSARVIVTLEGSNIILSLIPINFYLENNIK